MNLTYHTMLEPYPEPHHQGWYTGAWCMRQVWKIRVTGKVNELGVSYDTRAIPRASPSRLVHWCMRQVWKVRLTGKVYKLDVSYDTRAIPRASPSRLVHWCMGQAGMEGQTYWKSK